MGRATRPLHDRIALVFDFDETLAPSSLDTLLRDLGHDPEVFRHEHIDPRKEDGWELHFAQFYALLHDSWERDDPITRDRLRRVGESLEPFEGVPEMFGHLRAVADAAAPGVKVEFYVLTAGFADMHRHAPIAPEFEQIWGSEFAFDDDGRAEFPRQIVTFPEKERYVLQLAKGLWNRGPSGPGDVYRDVPAEELHVPLDQVVYVGDGASDMPVFDLMHREGGVALGVYPEGGSARAWEGQEKMRPVRRVLNLAPSDFRPGSELMRSLELAVESIAKRVALLRMSRGE